MSISIYQESALKRHDFKVASLRDAAQTMFLSSHCAVWGVAPSGCDTVHNCLYGVIEIQPLRGCGDGNQSEILNCRIIQNLRASNGVWRCRDSCSGRWRTGRMWGVPLRDRGVVGPDTRGGGAGCGQAEGELSALTAVVEEGVLGKGKAGRIGAVKTAHGAGERRNGFFLLLCRKFCVFLHCL